MNWTRANITAFLILAVTAWTAVLYFRNIPITKDMLAPFGFVSGFLGVFAFGLEHEFWHWRVVHPWFVDRPDLRGTWRVELQSSWKNPETGVQIGPIEGFMAVRQTLSKLHMHMMTKESESWLVAESICTSEKSGGYRVSAVYTNQPHLELRGVRSEIHFGAWVLDTHGQKPWRPDTLTGEYWTDRATRGTLTLTGRMATEYSRFEDAKLNVLSASKRRSR